MFYLLYQKHPTQVSGEHGNVWNVIKIHQFQQIKGQLLATCMVIAVPGYLINFVVITKPQMKIIEEQFQPTSQVKDPLPQQRRKGSYFGHININR